MGKFIVEPHFRLQEWVAEEKGYFGAEGLDYEFREFIRASGGAHHASERLAPKDTTRSDDARSKAGGALIPCDSRMMSAEPSR